MTSQAAVTTVHDSAFRSVVPLGAALTAMPAGWDIGGGDSAGWGRGVTGVCWVESLGGVLFSDTAHKRRLAWVPGSDPQLAARTPGAITGTAIDRAGRLIGCDWSGHRIIAEQDGETTVLAADCAGTGFNRPWDVCLGQGDDLLFVDQKIPFPPTSPAQASGRGGEALLEQQVKAFGGGSGLAASDRSGVYRISGAATEDTGIVLTLPGGLAFDAPRSRLLVSEPRAQRIHAYPVRADGSVDGAAGTG
jgi:gluconolactonase